MNEIQLIALLKDGDKAAMRTLYDRHIGYLTAVGQRYVDDESLRDVLQESFIRIYTSISRFEYRGEGSLRAWMVRIVVNEALKSLKASSQRTVPLDGREQIEEEEPPTSDVPIEVIHRLIRELPEGYRTVFNLYVFEQYSHREIASMLGIGENSSASQLHRAKSLLARKIKEYKQLNR